MASHFRGASAASLATVLDAVENTSGDLSTVGGDLFAVTAALDATPAVRRVLTDPSASADARAGLAASVLGGKVARVLRPFVSTELSVSIVLTKSVV